MTTAIRTHDLTKDCGSGRGLLDLGLEVRAGEVFGYLGPNGAGKTTTIRLLSGADPTVERASRDIRAGLPGTIGGREAAGRLRPR